MYDSQFRTIEVHFADGKIGIGRAVWVNAVWMCRCDDPAPLYGYSRPNAKSDPVICPTCGRTYDVEAGDDGLALLIRETSGQPRSWNKQNEIADEPKRIPKRTAVRVIDVVKLKILDPQKRS